jgi:FkbM family methyltransferase
MKNFEELTSYRECNHEDVDKLLWVTTDSGAWDGPLMDWKQESKNFMEQVYKFDLVIQAGGNCGMYPRFYKNYFKKVITFEPDDVNYYCLNKNCVGPEYKKYHGALGNTTQKFTLNNKSTKNVGTHTIKEQPGDIQMYRIDDLDLDHCDLIHLDIEGYEEKAILGAVNTIHKFKPVIIVERGIGSNTLKTYGYKLHEKLRMDSVFIKV